MATIMASDNLLGAVARRVVASLPEPSGIILPRSRGEGGGKEGGGGVKPINENLVTTDRLRAVKVVFAGRAAFVIPGDSSRSRADFITRAAARALKRDVK
jgi:hypothetical protein